MAQTGVERVWGVGWGGGYLTSIFDVDSKSLTQNTGPWGSNQENKEKILVYVLLY